MTERRDRLDRSPLGKKSEGGGGKRGKEGNEGNGGGGGDAAWLYFPNKAPNKCVCVHAWVFVSVSERDCDMEGWGLL